MYMYHGTHVEIRGQMFAPKPDDLNLSPQIQKMEGENKFQSCPLTFMCRSLYMYVHTQHTVHKLKKSL